MTSLRVRTFLLFMLVLSTCGFDGDELREYLPEEVRDAQSLYNERDFLICAVSIYQVPKEIGFSQVPFSKPNRASTEWLPLPLDGKVGNRIEDGVFATQALFDGDECFDEEANRILGFNKLSEYYSAVREGFFIEVHYNAILVHDMDLDLIILSVRAH